MSNVHPESVRCLNNTRKEWLNQNESQALISLLQQKYPFLMIDYIISFNSAVEIEGLKTFSAMDYTGLKKQILPLYVLIEIMGQMSEILIRASFKLDTKKGILAAISQLFITPYDIRIGETLVIKSTLKSIFNGFYQTFVTVTIGELKISEGFFTHAFK
ncbi:MAG: hypothetical protein K6U80_14050 [Firmicutes bacterium]|nr:hypothetical protein [Bacillota bacterium]